MTPEELIKSLNEERTNLVNSYNELVDQQAKVKTRLVEIQGAIQSLSELNKSDEDPET